MTETRVFLIRHGEAEGLRPGAFLGRLDLPLMFKIHQDYGCVNVIEIADGFPMVRRFNASPGLL